MSEISRRNFVAALGLAAIAVPGALALSGCSSNSSSSTSGSSTASSTGSSKADSSAAGKAASGSSEYKLVESGKLVCACSPDYPPMEYQDGDQIVGFTYGLMSEVADRLDLELNMVSQSFDSLVTAVAAGTKVDCACSSITINDTRLEEVDFSDPYYDSNLAIVVLKDSGYTSRDDLDGQPIGAQSGSTGEDWVKENLKDNDYTPFDSMTECMSSLRTGKISAAVFDEPVASNMVNGEYDDCEILDVIATGEQYGIAINKDNSGLLDAINGALADMKSDGTLDDLKKTWIEGDGTAKKASSSASEKASSAGKASSSASEKSAAADKSGSADSSKD